MERSAFRNMAIRAYRAFDDAAIACASLIAGVIVVGLLFWVGLGG